MKIRIARILVAFIMLVSSLSIAHAFGAGPTSLSFNPLVPNRSKEFVITVTRSAPGPKEFFSVEVNGDIKDIVSMKPGASLFFDEGEIKQEVTFVARANSNRIGSHKGEILMKHAGDISQGGTAANGVVIPVSVTINVGNDESGLLSISNSDYRWSQNTNEVLLRFQVVNERSYSSGIEKVVFSIKKGSKDPVQLESPTHEPLLESDTQKSYSMSVPVAVGEYGTWEISAKYYDEKDMLISAPIMQTVFVNPPLTEHMRLVRYFVYVIVAALAVAALLMADYFYLRKKYPR